MTGFLDKAAVSARSNVTKWKKRFPDPSSMVRARQRPFLPSDGARCGVIAEIKRRSPSRGDLMGQADPAGVSQIYARGGAEAVSVVVEEHYFGGSPDLFMKIARSTTLPLLWKDFVVDPYQLLLASALGASAVLLIAGMLTDAELSSFLAMASQQSMRPLVEVHDQADLDRAVKAGADLIGINNRDLITLKVDVGVSESFALKFPVGTQMVSESGIRTPEDVKRMAACGYRAVLVGESLVTAENTEELLRGMVEAGKSSV